jgi:hypothetical protein
MSDGMDDMCLRNSVFIRADEHAQGPCNIMVDPDTRAPENGICLTEESCYIMILFHINSTIKKRKVVRVRLPLHPTIPVH